VHPRSRSREEQEQEQGPRKARHLERRDNRTRRRMNDAMMRVERDEAVQMQR
jgi:hypothetical protein